MTTYIYVVETFPSHICAKGMSISILAYFASLIIYLEVAPTAFTATRWKFHLAFLIALFFLILPLFLSFEQVARLFDDKVTTVRLDDRSAEESPKETEKSAASMLLVERTE